MSTQGLHILQKITKVSDLDTDAKGCLCPDLTPFLRGFLNFLVNVKSC